MSSSQCGYPVGNRFLNTIYHQSAIYPAAGEPSIAQIFDEACRFPEKSSREKHSEAADFRPIDVFTRTQAKTPDSTGKEWFWIYVSCLLQQINAPLRRAWRRLRCQLQMVENALDSGSSIAAMILCLPPMTADLRPLIKVVKAIRHYF